MLRRLAGLALAGLLAACSNAKSDPNPPPEAVPCAADGRGKGFCPAGQVCGSIGCRPCEGHGECGEGKQCCAGMCLQTEQCALCRTSLECGAGRACCDGVCAQGECCSAADCQGRECKANHCSAAPAKLAVPSAPRACTGQGCDTGRACVFDGECSTTERCCGGKCVQGECCGSSECEGRVCGDDHRCRACTTSSQCGAGSVCCGGLCSAGDCCGEGDCESGQICTANRCDACTSDLQCGPGESCCGGRCAEGLCQLKPGCRDGLCSMQLGGCTTSAQCGAGLVCADGRCTAPTTLATFAAGQACSAANPCTGFAEVCCNSVCVIGECCTDTQCARPLQCLQNACQSCTSDGQCGAGRVCCGGTCQSGSCCPGAPCPSGQICSGFQCAACAANTDCGAGQVCCSGVCKTGNCCTTASCGSFICLNNSCSACTSNADCGANGLCCGGACVSNATCCTRSDCPSGQICSNNNCSSCSRDTDCGLGLKCCGGTCRGGDCCTTADCRPGLVCNANNFCSTCASDTQCAAGQRCCSGSCTNGSCCQNADCGAGRVCTNNSCQLCTSNSQCGVGQLCCNGGCQTGNCCSNAECTDGAPDAGGLICTGNLCTQCQSDVQCGPGNKCCRGACYANRECCTSKDCTGSLACNAQGRCTSCAGDADCGGQRCCMDGTGIGRCAPFCAVSSTWSNPATFMQGTFNGTTAGGSPLNPACVPGTLCWAGSLVQVQVPYLWVPASGEGAVYRYNTNTGARAGPYYTGVSPSWPATPGVFAGDSPSRTSVNAFDGTVWIANRGFSSPGYNGPGSGAAHLDYNGNMICYAPVPGIARAMALDAAGNAWVGSYVNSLFYKFSATEFEPGNANPKQCRLLTVVAVPGSNPYGAAVDNRGDMWVQDCPSCGTVSAVSTTTNTYLGRWSSGCGQYGLTVDRDYVWLGCYYSSGVGRLTKAQNGPTRITRTDFVSTGGNPRGLASSPDGFVYAGLANNQVAKIHRNSMQTSIITVPTSHSITAAVDGVNRVWTVDYYGPVVRIETNGQQTVFAGSPNGQYVYTDVTGQQTINAGLTPGLWNVIYDSMYATPRWLRVVMQAQQPAGTTVEVRVRSAATQGGLPGAPWSVWFSSFPANLATAGVPSRRFLEIQVKLTTASDTTSPVVTSVSAEWSPF